MARGRFGRTAEVEAPTVDEPTFTEPTLDSQVSEPEVAVEEPTTEAAPEQQEESTTVTDTLEAPTQEQATEQAAEQATETTERKRAPRPAINVGNVVVRKSERTDFTTRTTPTESNPVFLAVKNAELEEATDILVENDERKIQGAISILRRAGAKLKLGMHIAPKGTGYPTEEVEGTTYAVLTFKTSAERQDRKAKAADATEVAASE